MFCCNFFPRFLCFHVIRSKLQVSLSNSRMVSLIVVWIRMASLKSSNTEAIHLIQEDAQHLLEELQTQKEELEAQNDKLLRTPSELGKSRREHVEFYQLAPIDYIMLDSSRCIIEGNVTITESFNYDPKQPNASHTTCFIPRESASCQGTVSRHSRCPMLEGDSPGTAA